MSATPAGIEDNRANMASARGNRHTFGSSTKTCSCAENACNAYAKLEKRECVRLRGPCVALTEMTEILLPSEYPPTTWRASSPPLTAEEASTTI